MPIKFADAAWEDYLYWQAADKATLKRIHALLKDIRRSPFDGIGKPEPLKYIGADVWSRRITQEHRLVYRAMDGVLQIAQCRYHY